MKEPTVAEQAFKIIYNARHEDIKDISVSRLASRLGVTPEHLSRSFRQRFENTLKSFISVRIIRNIFNFLQYRPDLSVKEIAAILDFHDVHGLIKLFKRQMGITPGRFRKCVLGDPNCSKKRKS